MRVKPHWVCHCAHNISYAQNLSGSVAMLTIYHINAKSYTHFDWFLFVIYWGTDVYM